MTNFDLKTLKKDLEAGQAYPVYVLHGPETFLAKEAVTLIKQHLSPNAFNTHVFEGAEVKPHQLIDLCMELPFGGGIRFIWLKDADGCKDLEELKPLLGPKQSLSSLSFVLVLQMKHLDQRRTSSKLFSKNAVILECAPIAEDKRIGWIQFLAKRYNTVLPDEIVQTFLSLEPWSLDRLEREIEKYTLYPHQDLKNQNLFLANTFVDAFFSRQTKQVMELVETLSSDLDLALPLLGLLNWNLRKLRAFKLNGRQSSESFFPLLLRSLEKWAPHWTHGQLQELQESLLAMDFEIKQTRTIGLGIWSHRVQQFAHTLK